jgi:hypothetical protein
LGSHQGQHLNPHRRHLWVQKLGCAGHWLHRHAPLRLLLQLRQRLQ